MTGTLVEIRHNKWPAQRKLALDTGTRDAMADYWRLRWPSNTAKLGAREFGLTLDQGRSVVAGKASLTTIDQIEKAGGWPVIFAVKALVIGQGADQFLSELKATHHDQAERLAALTGDHWPLRPSGTDAADRVGERVADRRESVRRRVG